MSRSSHHLFKEHFTQVSTHRTFKTRINVNKRQFTAIGQQPNNNNKRKISIFKKINSELFDQFISTKPWSYSRIGRLIDLFMFLYVAVEELGQMEPEPLCLEPQPRAAPPRGPWADPEIRSSGDRVRQGSPFPGCSLWKPQSTNRKHISSDQDGSLCPLCRAL